MLTSLHSPRLSFWSLTVLPGKDRYRCCAQITPQLSLPTGTCSPDLHTYVIVIAGAVKMWMDYQLFYREDLFLLCVGFIGGLLPQVYWEDVGVVAEQMSRRKYFRYAKRTEARTAAAAGDKVFLGVVSPNKTVCSSNNPARRNERTTAKETTAKNSCNPRLWLYSCKRTVHDFSGPLFRPLTTWQLCRDTQDEFREEQRGRTTARRALKYLCPIQRAGVLLSLWGLWRSRSSDQKAALHKMLTFFI